MEFCYGFVNLYILSRGIWVETDGMDILLYFVDKSQQNISLALAIL